MPEGMTVETDDTPQGRHGETANDARDGRFGGTPALLGESDEAIYNMIYSVRDADEPLTDLEDQDAIRFVVRVVRDPSQITSILAPVRPCRSEFPDQANWRALWFNTDGISEGEVRTDADLEMAEVMPMFVPSTDENNRYEVIVPTDIATVDITLIASTSPSLAVACP